MYKHILVPTDGSELANRGVTAAVELAKSLSAKITLLHAVEAFNAAFTSPDGAWIGGAELYSQIEAAQTENAEKILQEASQTVAASGVLFEAVSTKDSPPADAIVKAAEEKGCDLIVIASHGRRGVSRMVLGSQTSEVLAHSKVPVLVIR